jgi:hypothetical protein
MSANALSDNTKTAVIAVIATVIGVAVISEFTAIPEVITQLTFSIGGAVVSGLATLGVLLVPRVRALAPEQQRKIIWLTASCSGLIFLLISCFVSLGHHGSNR